MLDFTTFDHICFPIFVLEIDENRVPRYVAFNAFARKLSGRPLSDYINQTAKDVYPGDCGETVYDYHVKAALGGHNTTYQVELPLNGKRRMIRTTLSPLNGVNQKIKWLFGSSQDVTEQEKIALSQKKRDGVSEEMTQFIAIAAHDLRAPMRNVALLTDILREEFVDHKDGKLEIIDMLETIARTSQSLLTDVLCTAQQTKASQKSGILDLRDLCTSIQKVLDPSNNHSVNAPCVKLHIDRRMLQIALRNIIENAFKHADRGHVDIEITVRTASDGMITLSIRDNGKGFSQGALAFLDGGRFQVDSGYGLFGVKRLVAMRGGMVRASNADGDAGACVDITLPGSIIDTQLSRLSVPQPAPSRKYPLPLPPLRA